MKTSITITWSNARKTVLFAALFLFITLSKEVQAADSLKKPPVEVRYIGAIDHNPVFQIEVDNQNGEEMYLTIRDEYGTHIYSEVIKEKKYSRKIHLVSEEADDKKLTLSLRTKKSNQTQVFQIYKTTRTIEEIAVSKL